MISMAMPKMIWNSSYVLIIITTLRKVSDWVRARPPAPWVNIRSYLEYSINIFFQQVNNTV